MSELIPPTHEELVKLGAKYLEGYHSACGKRLPAHCIVTTGIGSGEIPDVLGFYGSGQTTLVECKISRQDFQADSHKHFRKYPEHGMGNHRYYLTPEGLLSETDLPDKWGLMEHRNGKIKTLKISEHQKSRKEYEICVLQSLIRRIGQNTPKGVSVKFYTYETKNTCTAGACDNHRLPTGRTVNNENRN